MYLGTHFLAGFLSARLFGFDILYSLMAGVLSMLIDLDHMVTYSIQKKSLKFREVWNRCVREEINPRSFIHKAPGIVLVTAIISLVYLLISKDVAKIMASAYYSHMILDSVEFKRKRHWDFGKILTIRVSIEDIILDSLLLAGIAVSFI